MSKIQPELILASSSPRRQELIRMLGLPVRIMVSHADESTPDGMPPSQIVETLSLRKAQVVADQCTDPSQQGSIVVGSDTIVVLNDRVYGKPLDQTDASRMLRELQGRTHQVYTGLACIPVGAPQGDYKPAIGHTVNHVTFRTMCEEEIEGYVQTGDPMDKAGAYGIQGLGACFIEKIEGDFYSVMGLPLNLLYQMLLKFDISPFRVGD
jgi:septum formation protein